ncbi:MAG: hypothetical protein EHM41_14915 [Chloroflexi bacterium]|nr:MAG: hypothetical protein EHM41_14915 [Chloroflexota bacterium]
MDYSKRKYRIYLLVVAVLIAAAAACNLPATIVTPTNTLPPSIIEFPTSTAGVLLTGPAAAQPTSQPAVAIPIPTSTSLPIPTPSPAPSLIQLTSSGCCVSPFWANDGSGIMFIDKPSSEALAGIWGVSLNGGSPSLITTRLGIYSKDMQLLAYPQAEQTYVERIATGERWIIPSKGRAVSFSPDGTWLAWTAGSLEPPFDTAQRQVWISRFDGTEARVICEVTGGGFAGWTPDARMVITGRENGTTVVWLTKEGNGELEEVCDGNIFEMVRAERLRGVSLSPGGSWLAYQVTFSSSPEANGMWVVNTSTLERRKLPVFGAFRWRDDDSLLVVPLELGQEWHLLVQVEASTGEAINLTTPGVTNFKIAKGDWSVSPDGRYVAFVSAVDMNVWVMALP